MRAPTFWACPPDDPGLAARLLHPIGLAVASIGRWRRRLARPVRVSAPVICVGNLTAGGAGKTPVAMALLDHLAQRGERPHALSRGHGGSERGPHRVDPAADGAERVGDEPLLLATAAPTWVSRDRVAGARAAVDAGTSAIVMDDGFQNPRLAKDVSMVVVNAARGFGNGRLLPAGPLREPVAEGLARCDAVVLVGEDDAAAACLAAWPILSSVPILRARLEPLATGLPLDFAPIVAFAGIAYPQAFFDTLRSLGATVIATHAFADHEPYRPKILRRLVAEARRHDAMLVTTEKDAVRLPPSFRQEVVALPTRLRFDDLAALDAVLNPALSRASVPRA
jgi:tetraacyldisaccharide 4'-kinase